MNAKGINLIDKETGEQTAGTMQEIADKINVSRMTLSRWMKTGSFENESYILSNVTPEQPNVTLEPNVTSPNVTQEEEKTPNVTFTPPKISNVTRGIKTDPSGKVLLPRKPCIKCGQPVYHTLKIDGKIQHICFNSCTPPIIKVVKPINQQTLEYIRSFNKANSPKEKENTDI